MPRHYLSVCAMFRDEAPYLEEWIAFHLDQGVEHFFLYDHGSSDDFRDRLAPYLADGTATLTTWTVAEKGKAQRQAYDDCLAQHGASSRWIAFIDLDEFLFNPEGKRLPEVLRDYEEHPGVFVFWRCYGSSGHRERPAGLVTDSYLRRAPSQWRRNRQGKSIVDPSRALSATGPHYFTYKDGALPVNEGREPVRVRMSSRLLRFLARSVGPWWPTFPGDAYSYRNAGPVGTGAERLRINHYLIKSLADYDGKMRKNNRTKSHKAKYTPRFFRYHDRNEVEDPVLRGRVRLRAKRSA